MPKAFAAGRGVFGVRLNDLLYALQRALTLGDELSTETRPLAPKTVCTLLGECSFILRLLPTCLTLPSATFASRSPEDKPPEPFPPLAAHPLARRSTGPYSLRRVQHFWVRTDDSNFVACYCPVFTAYNAQVSGGWCGAAFAQTWRSHAQ